MSEIRLEQLEERARSIGHAIGEKLPDGMLFCLMLFNEGEGGFSTYISNANPADMVKALRELADKREEMLAQGR